MPKLQRTVTHEKFFRIYSKINQGIYSSLSVYSSSCKALASIAFFFFFFLDILPTRENAQIYKGPLLMKYFFQNFLSHLFIFINQFIKF